MIVFASIAVLVAIVVGSVTTAAVFVIIAAHPSVFETCGALKLGCVLREQARRRVKTAIFRARRVT
jgi:hypothetical protein